MNIVAKLSEDTIKSAVEAHKTYQSHASDVSDRCVTL